MSRRYFTPKGYSTWAIVIDDENQTTLIQWERPGGYGPWDQGDFYGYNNWKGGEVANPHWQPHKACSFRKWLRDHKFTDLPL